MSQSPARNILHIIFSTKYRRPLITPAVRVNLNEYLGGILRQLNCPSIEINCSPDHAHVLCCLSKNLALADMLEELKKGSSRWMKSQGPEFEEFYWQAGYGAASVSPSNVEVVQRYIKQQEQHHCRMTFQEEFREFLRRHQIEFDERYVWD